MATTGAIPLDRKRPGPYDVFICYDRDDAKLVEQLVEALESRGMNTWLDQDDIPFGEEWLKAAHRGIEDSHSFVYVVTPGSLHSEECAVERARAEELEKRIVAAICSSVDDAEIHPSLKRRQWVDFTHGHEFEDSIADLIDAVKHDAWREHHTDFLGRAEAWKKSGRDTDMLLTGRRLAAAELWLEEAALSPDRRVTDLQREFIDAGRARARRQRWGKRAALAVIPLAVVVVLAFLLMDARSDEEVAQARELASEAFVKMPSDPELGMLLALESLERSPTSDADNALRAAVARSRIRRTLGTPSDRDRAAIQDAAFSRDGTRVVTASSNGEVKVWPADGPGKPLSLEGHKAGTTVITARFSPNGRLVASVGDDETARLWNAGTGTGITKLTHPGGTTDVEVIPSGEGLLTVGRDGSDRAELRLWGPDGDLRRKLSFGPSDPAVHPAGFMGPTGSVLVSTGATVRLFDLADLDAPPRVLRHGAAVSWAAFAQDGTRVATADQGRVDGFGTGATAKIWDARSGELVHTLRSGAGGVFSVAFSTDGELLATGNQQSTATVWNVRSGRRLRELRGHTDVVQSVWFSAGHPDASRFLLTGSDDRDARIWDLAYSGEPEEEAGKREVSDRIVSVLHGGRATEVGVRFDADGERVVMARGDGTATVFDAIPGQIERRREENFDFSMTPDGAPMAVLERDPADFLDFRVALWDVRGWKVDSSWIDRDGQLALALPSADGKLLFRSDAVGRERIIDLRDGMNRDRDVLLDDAPATATAAAFAPGSKLLATGHQGGALRIWNTRTGAPARDEPLVPADDKKQDALGGRQVWGLAFSNDGKQLLAARTDGLRLWRNGPAGWSEVPMPAAHTDKAFAVAFSHSGEMVASTGNDGKVLLWDASSGTPRLAGALLGHEAIPVTSASFSADDRFLATSGWDGTVRIWDPATERQLAEYNPEGGRVKRVAFAADGVTLVAQSDDGSLVRMICEICRPLDDVVRLAERRLEATGRALTDGERRRYLHDD